MSSCCCSGPASASSSQQSSACCGTKDTKASTSSSCCSETKATPSSSCCSGSDPHEIKDETSERMDTTEGVKASVRDYYGKRVKKTEDLKTNTCTTGGSLPAYLKKALTKVPDEILSKYYGCGSPLPAGIKGLNVLDLGSGSGRDCYVASAMVGEQGNVYGVDMTDEQLAIARKYIDVYCKQTLGYAKNNLTFYKGFIENLREAGVQPDSVHLCISNCVINLSPDKPAVLKGVYSALKNGGEMYFSDIYSDRRVPEHVKRNEVLWGECLSGALYVNDFVHVCKQSGFIAPRVLSVKPVPLVKESHAKLLGDTRFYSILFRLFKLEKPASASASVASSSSAAVSATANATQPMSMLEPTEEDYGQIATYLGTIPEQPHSYDFDLSYKFITNKPMPVSGNVATILQHSWLAPFFTVQGNRDHHFGPFPETRAMWNAMQAFPESAFVASAGSRKGGCC